MGQRLTPLERRRLWEAKGSGSEAARNTLIEAHGYLVGQTVLRLCPRGSQNVEPDDLVSAGYQALIAAVDRFDPGRGVQFSSFAISLIRGAIREELRRQDWVPRLARQKQRDEGIEPLQVISLFDRTGLHSEEVDPLAVIEQIPDPGPGPEAQVFAKAQQGVWWWVKRLPQRERAVIEQYYAGGRWFREIAEAMDLSVSRVCQLHDAGLTRLKGMLRVPEVIGA